MNSRSRIAWLVAVLALAACAKTVVTERQHTLLEERLPRPEHIFVYDFAATAEEVPANSALAGHPSVVSASQTPQEIEIGRQVGAEVAKALVADIDAMGLPAVRGTSESTPVPGDLVIRGYLLSVQSGSELERVAVGMGKGNAELKTAVEGFRVTDHGLEKLGGASVDSGGGKTPGAAVPLVVALATKNPLGLIVSTGVKLHEENTGASTIQGRDRKSVV